jgi:hypothetical protein
VIKAERVTPVFFRQMFPLGCEDWMHAHRHHVVIDDHRAASGLPAQYQASDRMSELDQDGVVGAGTTNSP